MRPHADDFYNFVFFDDLVDDTVLNIDTSRTGACQVADEFFVGGWGLVGIFFKNFQNFQGFVFQS